MGVAHTASPTGPLPKDLLHPQSMNVTEAFGNVTLGTGRYPFNYQAQLSVTPRGTWLCVWTQGSHEADRDQRVVLARSNDTGQTWSSEIVIESADGAYRVPAWIMIFTVPHTGRVYVFYWYNLHEVPLRDAGDIFFKYSDDDGFTWSERFPLNVPRKAADDPDGDIHGWNFGQPRLLPTGQVMFTFNKMRRSAMYPPGWKLDKQHQWIAPPDSKTDEKEPIQGGDPNNWETEVWFVECENILTESDPQQLKFRFLPDGEAGLWVTYPDSTRHFGQEGTIVGLSGNRLLCVFRSRRGHAYFSISSDKGHTWSTPDVLRYCPGGEPIEQPCAPCPIHKTADGRFVFVFHNAAPQGRGGIPVTLCGSRWRVKPPAWAKTRGYFLTRPKSFSTMTAFPAAHSMTPKFRIRSFTKSQASTISSTPIKHLKFASIKLRRSYWTTPAYHDKEYKK